MVQHIAKHFKCYAQKNPKQEYKREAFEMFGNMLDQIKNEIVRIVMTIKIRDAEELEQAESTMEAAAATDNVSYQHADPANLNQGGDAGIANAPADEASKERPFQRFGDKIGWRVCNTHITVLVQIRRVSMLI